MLIALLLACASNLDPVPTVLLVSMDTTRADALGCYGARDASTPVMDGLAEQGVRFSWALAHAPTTLSSHASVFTGEDPHTHGVVRNGYPVNPSLPRLAERFSDAGWDTLAVVGASTLEGGMGLAQGFRVYEDQLSHDMGPRFEDRADEVTRRAIEVLDGRKQGAPLLLFVHYFDAHSPWNSAPDAFRDGLLDSSYTGSIDGERRSIAELQRGLRGEGLASVDRERARSLYLAEVSWADAQLGVLLGELEERGLMEDSLVAVFSDHGETLDEIPERPYGHGLDVDLVDIHVPLILAARGRFQVPVKRTVDSLVRLQDVGSTILGLVGLPHHLGQGRDLSGIWEGAPIPEVPSFAEATKPEVNERKDAWPNLSFERSVAFGGYLLTRFPLLDEQGLFRLERAQPVVERAELEEELGMLLDAWDATAPAFRARPENDEVLEGLRALGYIDE